MIMAKKKQTSTQNYHCRDCKHAFDFHELNWKGEPRDNKTLASFAEALRKVMEKFEI